MSGALAGLRVLDLTRLLPGGFCSLLLADFGADVLKVEDTGAGDYLRWTPPHVAGRRPERALGRLPRAQPRQALRSGIDLKRRSGREVLLRLVREHDVLLESFRPGVLDRLGVGYERLREENPRLVYCAITGYGQEGPGPRPPGPRPELPRAQRPARAHGRARRAARRRRPGQIADVGGGALTAAFGIMAALWERERSGEGQLVDVAMTAASQRWLAMVAAGVLAGAPGAGARRAELAGGLACYRPYRVRRRLGRARRARAEVLARAVRRARPPRPRARATSTRASAAELEAVFAARTRAEWAAFADAHPCCLEPVLELDEALEPRARGRRGGGAAGRRAPCGCSARRSGSRARRPTTRAPRPALGRAHARGPGGARLRAATRSPRWRRAAPWRELTASRDDASSRSSPTSAADRFRASASTAGPWDPGCSTPGRRRAARPRAGGVRAARPDMVLARVTLDILGAVPVARSRSARARGAAGALGRAAGGDAGGGRPRGRRRARLARRPARRARRRATPPPPPPLPGRPAAARRRSRGYGDAVELRFARGGWRRAGARDGVDAAAGARRGRRGAHRPAARARRGRLGQRRQRGAALRGLDVHQPRALRAPAPGGARGVDLPRRRDDRGGRRRRAGALHAERRRGPVAHGAQSLLVAPRP